jgi:hypothetical protein
MGAAPNLQRHQRVYDSQGNRTGYTTVRSDVVTNLYSQDGTRQGYIPAPTEGGSKQLWGK